MYVWLLYVISDIFSGWNDEQAHYTGKLENGTVFDSSYNRGMPLSFRIGVGEVYIKSLLVLQNEPIERNKYNYLINILTLYMF